MGDCVLPSELMLRIDDEDISVNTRSATLSSNFYVRIKPSAKSLKKVSSFSSSGGRFSGRFSSPSRSSTPRMAQRKATPTTRQSPQPPKQQPKSRAESNPAQAIAQQMFEEGNLTQQEYDEVSRNTIRRAGGFLTIVSCSYQSMYFAQPSTPHPPPAHHCALFTT